MNQKTASLTIRKEQDQLWQKIAAFPFDAPGAPFPFSRRLARENKWDYDFGQQAIEEYRKFIFLCCISPQGASPSKVIDEVWHLHLIYTQNYWEEFCSKTLNRNIHHYPSTGGSPEKEKHKNWRADTLALYRDTFHTAPPPAFWDDNCFPSPGRFNLLPRFLKRRSPLLLLLLLLFLAACNGPSSGYAPFFIIIAIIVFGSIVTSAQGTSTNKERKRDESSGNSCSSGCSSGCGSGCGGGCGGCGGCGS
ncbi:hypothetical protein [Chitinophaga sp. GbtcB8]|uniref:glycine-rich domain-containing protein n=1 Tax=Chitinophaga sp. GbtcB8 TaxID=2824753 RepID=UPI001C3078B7|nr:hypothetical protein [Chitinophaga sp. GbtcB8]